MSSDRAVDLLLIGGLAGCGKSSLGREVARMRRFALYDKDTVTGPLVEKLLIAFKSPGGADDRESDIYSTHVRPAEYEGLMNAVVESVGLGISTVAVSPFLREMVDVDWRVALEHTCERIHSGRVHVHYVWVHATEEVMRARLLRRGLERDRYKLENWNDYVATVRTLRPRRPCFELDCSDDEQAANRAMRVVSQLGLS